METLIIAHGVLAYVSLALLLTRGVLSVRNVNWRAFKLLKIAPHAVDTFLLGTGVALVATLLVNDYAAPNELTWLLPKLMFLVLYVLFSAKTFRKNQPFSLKFFLLAVVSFMCAIFVAAFR